MGQQRSAPSMRSGLTAKGFREKRGGDHYRLVYYDGEQPTEVWTKISHHSTFIYRDKMLGKVQKQIRLSSQDELIALVDCPMKEERYRVILREQGILQ